MNRIFGGGYNSRLNTEVRVKKGLTYGAYSSFNPHRQAGSFGVATFTRTAATVDATKLVVDLIAKMSTGDVTPQEMDFARDYLAGVYPIQSETAEQVADRVLTVAAFDLPTDYNYTYPDRIRGVTPAQVKEMAQKYLEHGRSGYRAGRKRQRVSRRLEESLSQREVSGNSIRPRGCPGPGSDGLREGENKLAESESRRLLWLADGEDHFAEVLAVVDKLMRRRSLVEREILGDHGFQLSRPVHAAQLVQLAAQQGAKPR